jgi:hypothetical protein
MLIVALIIFLIILIILDSNVSCFSNKNKISSFQDITLDDLNTIALSEMPSISYYNSTNPAVNECYKDDTNDYINSNNELVPLANNSNNTKELENVINSMYNIQHTENSGFSNKIKDEVTTMNKKNTVQTRRTHPTNDSQYKSL